MNSGHSKSTKRINLILFLLYIAALSYFLFFSERYGRNDSIHEYRYNLNLFNEIKRFYIYRNILGWEAVAVNLIGNVVAFAPFGFCLPILNEKYNKFFRIVFLSFLFSLIVETIQLIYQIGTFDVDDLLLNTVGGAIGYIIYRILYSISRKRRKRCAD